MKTAIAIWNIIILCIVMNLKYIAGVSQLMEKLNVRIIKISTQEVMIMRRKLTKAERKLIYEKCKGHCAYCGCELKYKDMQVDHVIPLNGCKEQGEDAIENMLPSCRSCNHYKSAAPLEYFRKAVERFPSVLMRDSVTYKNAVRFGLVHPDPHPVKFYFEEMNQENVVSEVPEAADIDHAIEYFKDELLQIKIFSDIVSFQERERKSIETALKVLHKVKKESQEGQQDNQCATSHG